jgi:hypothetical protein
MVIFSINTNTGTKCISPFDTFVPREFQIVIKGNKFSLWVYDNTSSIIFWFGNYNQIPGTVFNFLEMQNNEIEANTGVMGFSSGISGASIASTATAARGVMDATSPEAGSSGVTKNK